MRLLLGSLVLIVGLFWTAPGAMLVWRRINEGERVKQTGPNEFVISSTQVGEIHVLGKPVSFATACAISLAPGLLLIALGLAAISSTCLERRDAA